MSLFLPATFAVWPSSFLLAEPATASPTSAAVWIDSSSGGSGWPAISGDGSKVVFDTTDALVAGDTNGDADVYLYDFSANAFELISTGTGGALGNAFSAEPAISANGRYVAFGSPATTLSGGACTNFNHVYLRDLQLRTTTLVSPSGCISAGVNAGAVSNSGQVFLDQIDGQGLSHAKIYTPGVGLQSLPPVSGGGAENGESESGTISPDGHWATFWSDSSNLVGGAPAGSDDQSYRKDVVAGTIALVSAASDGTPANRTGSGAGAISDDGRYVAFPSDSTNLVAGDTNNAVDIFRKDMQTGAISRVDVTNSGGELGPGSDNTVAISGDGLYVGFVSLASELGADGVFWQVFVRDIVAGTTQMQSITGGGSPGNQHAAIGYGALSTSGSSIAFYSNATNLDSQGRAGVFATSVAASPTVLQTSERFGGINPSEACTACLTSIVSSGDPVDAGIGNFWHTIEDLGIPGRGPALDFAQTYNSLAAGTNGPLGYGWTYSYQMSLSVGSGDTPVTVNQENGSTVTFSLANGVYSAPGRVQATLVKNGDGTWAFVRKKRMTYTFNAAGQMVSIADLNGYATSLAYSSGKLSTVTDPAGRTMTFAYNGSLISSVTDSASPWRSVQFGYDGSGNLTSLTDVGGGVTTFQYDGAHRLTQMLDPNQQSAPTKHYLTNTYDTSTGKVTAQTDFASRTTSFDYWSIPGATKLTDPKGNVTVETFSAGVPTAVTRGYGTAQAATSTISYDTLTALPLQITDPLGHATRYTYDADGNVLTRTDAIDTNNPNSVGHTTTYTYDTLNDVLTMQDPNGVTTTYTYDTAGNLQSVSTPLVSQPGTNKVTSYTYGDVTHPGDITTMTDPDAKVWQYSYTSNGDLASVTDPMSPTADVTKFCYDNVGRRTRMILPKGVAAGVTCSTSNPPNTYVYTTNAFGDLLTSTDPLGHQTIKTYDFDRNLQTSKDPDTNQSSYVYDLDNEVTQVNRPDTTTLKNDYWPDGTLKSQTDGANQTTNYTYDPLTRIATVTDPNNRVTNYTHDAAGNQTAKQDPGGNCSATPKTGCTTFTYDPANQVTAITYSDGTTPNVTNIAYDNDGQRTAMTDGTGTSSWVWDSLHRLMSSTTGAAKTVGYGYDLRGNLTSIVYPGTTGTVTRGYDDAGRLHTITDWLSHTTTYNYDADSFLTSEAYPNTTTATFTPDAADRVMGITDAKSGTNFATFTYTRDNANQVTGVTSTGVPADSHTYSYTQLNQLKTQDSANFTYDTADNPVALANGNTQTFDAANQLTSSLSNPNITLVGGSAVGGGNTGSPATVTVNLPAGVQANDQIIVAATLQKSKTVNTPSGYTQIPGSPFQSGTANSSTKVAVFQKKAVGGESSVAVTFGNNTAKTVTAGVYRGVNPTSPIDVSSSNGVEGATSVVVPSVTTTVAGDRLVLFEGEASNSGSWTQPSGMTARITQSDGGNIRAVIADQTLSAAGATGSRTATFSTSAKLAGILLALKPAQTTYAYDTRGNRTTITPPTGSATTLGYDQANRLTSYGATATYGYNGDGLRMSKTISGTTTQQTWDTSQALPLVLVDGPTNYIYGPTGLPLGQINGSTVLYYQQDQLGSTRAITDSTGTAVGTYTYDPYGKLTASTGSITNPFGYAGQYTDTESGLQYLRARYYDPASGQFLTRDPITAQTQQPYQYAAGSPLNATDPSGLDTCGDDWNIGGLVDCGAKAGRGAKKVARETINEPFTLGAAAFAFASGGNCYTRGDHIECDGVAGVGSAPFTIGDTVINPSSTRLSADRWKHETNHSNWWAGLTPGGFMIAYAVDWALHGGHRECMWLEQAADARKGGYPPCGCPISSVR